jgi:hypothetical protein
VCARFVAVVAGWLFLLVMAVVVGGAICRLVQLDANTNTKKTQ